jgi:hypothetical protein
VAETDAPRVQLGDHVAVTTTALPGREFDAVIDNVGAQIDPVTHRLTVRATIANPDGALKPQMFANFTIRTPMTAKATHPMGLVSVPSLAVIHEGDSARVWVYLGKGRVKSREVTAGESHDGFVTILSGLKPGEKVVSAGRSSSTKPGSSDDRPCPVCAEAEADDRRLLRRHGRGGRYRLLQPQHRGLSRPGSADGRDRVAVLWPFGRGDGTQHHHPDRSADVGPAAHDAIRAISLFGLSDVKIQFTYDFTRTGAAAGDQSPRAVAAASRRRDPDAVADQPGR